MAESRLRLLADVYEQTTFDDRGQIRSVTPLAKGDLFVPRDKAERDRLVGLEVAEDPEAKAERAKADAEARVAEAEAALEEARRTPVVQEPGDAEAEIDARRAELAGEKPKKSLKSSG